MHNPLIKHKCNLFHTIHVASSIFKMYLSNGVYVYPSKVGKMPYHYLWVQLFIDKNGVQGHNSAL